MNVAFIDTIHEELWNRLSDSGITCIDYSKKTRDDILTLSKNIQGIVIRSKFPVDKSFLNIYSELKFIARSGAGLENIDIIYAKQKNIQIFNSPEGNRDAVAEHAMGMLLSLFNKLKQADLQVRNGIWDREGNRGLELKGKTVGLIGYGYMGQAFAERLNGFGCKVLAYDKYKINFGSDSVQEVPLKQLQERSDIISFHVPLTDETHYYFDDDFLSKCKKQIFLINTARGKNVKLTSLVNGLITGKVRGACLDVLEYEGSSFEKLQFDSETWNYLKSSDQVIVSPHVAGWTIESYKKLSTVLADKIIRWKKLN